MSFHPLKAGRRRGAGDDARSGDARFHPLKAGRRLSPPSPNLLLNRCFHPLKAGRRLQLLRMRSIGSSWFPSPQGGSETFSCQFSAPTH
jgi:hypothetical protein